MREKNSKKEHLFDLRNIDNVFNTIKGDIYSSIVKDELDSLKSDISSAVCSPKEMAKKDGLNKRALIVIDRKDMKNAYIRIINLHMVRHSLIQKLIRSKIVKTFSIEPVCTDYQLDMPKHNALPTWNNINESDYGLVQMSIVVGLVLKKCASYRAKCMSKICSNVPTFDTQPSFGKQLKSLVLGRQTENTIKRFVQVMNSFDLSVSKLCFSIGLRKGDLIIGVNGVQTISMEHFEYINKGLSGIPKKGNTGCVFSPTHDYGFFSHQNIKKDREAAAQIRKKESGNGGDDDSSLTESVSATTTTTDGTIRQDIIFFWFRLLPSDSEHRLPDVEIRNIFESRDIHSVYIEKGKDRSRKRKRSLEREDSELGYNVKRKRKLL